MEYVMALASISEIALILIREGAEALLIIAALAAYLSRLGDAGKLRVLYAGAALAVPASLLTAYLFQRFMDGMHNDALEGVIMLLAAVILLYVGGWLYGKRDAEAWQGYLQEQIDGRLDAGTLALGFTAFLAVYREGAETILFLHALAAGHGGWNTSMLFGLLLGSAVLLAGFLAVRVFALRLPLRPFFIATSAFLLLMALVFIGQAIQEFQELTWISYNDIALPAWLAELGLEPTWEALLTQAAVLATTLGITAMVDRGRQPSRN
jgi:high-affinity iron transporter